MDYVSPHSPLAVPRRISLEAMSASVSAYRNVHTHTCIDLLHIQQTLCAHICHPKRLEYTMSIPPSMNPKLLAGETIASAMGPPSNISPSEIYERDQTDNRLHTIGGWEPFFLPLPLLN